MKIGHLCGPQEPGSETGRSASLAPGASQGGAMRPSGPGKRSAPFQQVSGQPAQGGPRTPRGRRGSVKEGTAGTLPLSPFSSPCSGRRRTAGREGQSPPPAACRGCLGCPDGRPTDQGDGGSWWLPTEAKSQPAPPVPFLCPLERARLMGRGWPHCSREGREGVSHTCALWGKSHNRQKTPTCTHTQAHGHTRPRSW